jgi:hypothetical protein
MTFSLHCALLADGKSASVRESTAERAFRDKGRTHFIARRARSRSASTASAVSSNRSMARSTLPST